MFSEVLILESEPILFCNECQRFEAKVEDEAEVVDKNQTNKSDHHEAYTEFRGLILNVICVKKHIYRDRLDQKLVDQFCHIHKSQLFRHALTIINSDKDI